MYVWNAGRTGKEEELGDEGGNRAAGGLALAKRMPQQGDTHNRDREARERAIDIAETPT